MTRELPTLEKKTPFGRRAALAAGALLASAQVLCAGTFDEQREQIRNLANLTEAPVVTDAAGYGREGGMRAVYFEGLPWKGEPTRVFAWLGLPEHREGPVPGIVLVHGGGGTAFKEWVERWNARGFAAISIAVEGQTDRRAPKGPDEKRAGWASHEWPGPRRQGIYGDSAEPLKDQWMYHAVADTILANSLLRAMPEVDADKVGLMGISWGGVIASTVIGIDDRFAFAIPTYGCGHLSGAGNQYGRALGEDPIYREVWDPIHRLGNATMPVLWFSWPRDKHFPLDCQAASYRAAAGPRMVALVPGMGHGHGPPWRRPESYAFAEGVVRDGGPWCHQTESTVSEGHCMVAFASVQPLDKAVLVSTVDTGITGERTWIEHPAELTREGEAWRVTAKLPDGTSAWFVNVHRGDLTVSSAYEEARPEKTKAQGSVLDLFPDSGVSSSAGESTCSFTYAPSGSKWGAGLEEERVFMASIQSADWKLGVGKGGQIYSLRGPFGESIPPQKVGSPWMDEVWQAVITSEELIGPIHTFRNTNTEMRGATKPLMYFIHQAGIYARGAGKDGTGRAPFYSPCLRKRWNPETRTLEMVNWMQQANTPCVWKSGILIYTAYRDLGEGRIEVNQVLHNFGAEELGFLNAPWGGVRHSSLPHTVMSNPDGSWEKVEGTWNWTSIPFRPLVETGGWEAWAQDPEDDASPALALVFGFDREDLSNGKRVDEAIRWGTAGNVEVRDYQVTERMSHVRTRPGDSLAIRWYLVAGEFAEVRERAAALAEKARVRRIEFKASTKQPVWVTDGKVATKGEGAPWIELCAFPAKGSVPVFLLEDRNTGRQTLSADPYALAATEPHPNPIPEDLEIHEIYNDRVLYKQYSPHIGYQDLLGYAFRKKSAGVNARTLAAPEGVTLHPSARNLWIPGPESR